MELKRIRFTKEVNTQGTRIKDGDQWEVMMNQTADNNNHVFVRIGKRGKALNPYGNGNMIGLNNEHIKKLVNQKAIEIL